MNEINKDIKKIEEAKIGGFYNSKSNIKLTIIISLVVGILFPILVIGKDVGINYFIYLCAMLFSMAYVMHKDNNLDIKQFAFWGTAILIYSSIFFRLNALGGTILTILILPALFVFMTIYSSKNKPDNLIVDALIRMFGSIAFVNKIFLAIKSIKSKKNEHNKSIINIIIGVAISAAVLLVIIPLMFSADEMFQEFVSNLISLTSLAKFLWRSILAFAITILFFGFLYIITEKKNTFAEQEKKETIKTDHSQKILTMLVVIGFVYIVFAVVQFRYMFVGLNGVFPKGFSYTEYARSGYFELVVLTLINIMIILSSIIFTKNKTHKMSVIIKYVLSYFNVINLYLMISSTYKMYLYQDEYGFTVLRLLVYILLAYEFIVIILLQIKILKNNTNFIKLAVYVSVAFWAIVSLANIEGVNANLNIARYEETGKIDIHDIAYQSDVSSQLKYLYINHYDDFDKDEIKALEGSFCYWSNYHKVLTRESYEKRKEDLGWIDFNISRYKRYKDGLEMLEFKDTLK